jgi:septum formation topological specificity factor MinE
MAFEKKIYNTTGYFTNSNLPFELNGLELRTSNTAERLREYVAFKNQNFLRDDDVDKIVATYRDRLQEDKYSYRAPLLEVAENDFNLNISRYVSIAQDEVEIDLKAVNSNLIEIEKSIAVSLSQHNQFLEELGLPSLPLTLLNSIDV